METIVSIIVPVFRVPEKYLRKCIESCINQTLKEIEIVIVHDDFPDNCGQICDEYEKLDSRIKVIHNNLKINAGLSLARNIGVENSSAKWFTFVDGDDWIEPTYCETMLSFTDYQTDVVLCGYGKDYNGVLEPVVYQYEEIEVFNRTECKELQKRILDFNSHFSTAYAKLISRKLIEDNKIFHDQDLKQGVEGIEFNFRLFGSVKKAIFVNKCLYHYVYNDESLSVVLSEKTNQMLIKGYEKIYQDIESYDNSEELIPLLYDRIHYSIISTALRGYFNPKQKIKWLDREKKMDSFLHTTIIKKALFHKHKGYFSFSRKITLYLIRHRIYYGVFLIANLSNCIIRAKRG